MPDNNVMHAKPDLRVVLKWKITRSGSVITDVIPLGEPNEIPAANILRGVDIYWPKPRAREHAKPIRGEMGEDVKLKRTKKAA